MTQPPEAAPAPLAQEQPGKWAPFLAAHIPLTDRFGLRFACDYLDDARTTATYGSPPGHPPSPLAVVVTGHYRDDVQIFSVAPEWRWQPSPDFGLALAPQLNWVVSRGIVGYSSTDALILLIAPQPRREQAFTAGAGARVDWAIGARGALSLGYRYVDLAPSFERKAHALSAGVTWKF